MESSPGLTAHPLAAWRTLRRSYRGFTDLNLGISFSLRNDSKGLPYGFADDRQYKKGKEEAAPSEITDFVLLCTTVK